MVDVLILYEHKTRELENACLLCSELEKRGYKVIIQNISSLKKYFTRSKVVVVPHLYNNEQVINFAKNFWMDNDAIIDLQYEQVLSEDMKKYENNIHIPRQQAIYAHHIAWGEAQKQVYLDNGIDKCRVHVTGHIGMDLFRNNFRSYFKSRREIADAYNLDSDKKWILFISSFSYVNKLDDEMDYYRNIFPRIDEFREISEKSFDIIVEWLERAAKDKPEYIFIYRKHPAERENEKIIELQKLYSNFRCISDLSIRQWIVVGDKFLTWFSTSIVDAFFAKKNCNILRPVAIPKSIDVDILKDAEYICNYDEFLQCLDVQCNKFPANIDRIKYYYGSNDRKCAFAQIADLCEELIQKNAVTYSYDYGVSRWNMHNYNGFITIIKDYLYGLLLEICKVVKLSTFMEKMHVSERKLNKIRLYEQNVLNVKHEIEIYKKAFSKVINEKEIF